MSGAENIYPAEIDHALMSHPAVADVAVVGIPSEKWSETVKAMSAPTTGRDPSERELIAYCRR